VTAVISGIGWVTVNGTGRGKENNGFRVTDGQLPEPPREKIFLDSPYQRFGRMDNYSKLGLAAIAFALQDAELFQWKEKRDIGIIASTVYGCLNTDFDYYDTVIPQQGLLASPNLFAYTLPNCFLGDAAIRFGLTGEGFIVNEHNLSGLISIRIALDSIFSGDSQTMLAGVSEQGCPPLLKGTGKALPCAIFLVIERLSERNCSHYGKLDIDKNGVVLFNGMEVENVIGLVHRCLENLPKRS